MAESRFTPIRKGQEPTAQHIIELQAAVRPLSSETPVSGARYRQFVWTIIAGDLTFIVDGDGNPVTALLPLE